ncbi:hypothetical protein [Crocosphaera sp.]|uniref:hypothetical protein n=1 Tax=Crocosphaera sp. TaxID=2729996 RepID=UPI003F1FD159|nr:hypothetical protein [Crocosphaera sp.]
MKEISTSTKKYLKKHLVRIKNAIIEVATIKRQKVSTTEYLINHKIDPLKAIEIQDKKQDLLTKKLHNLIRILSTLLLMVSISPLSNNMDLQETTQYVLAIGLLTDVSGIQIIKKS